MLLNNFKDVIGAAIAGKPDTTDFRVTLTKGVKALGVTQLNTSKTTSIASPTRYTNNANNTNPPTFLYQGLAFGSGTTPPQITDYKLENHIDSGLTYSGGTYEIISPLQQIVITQTCTNTSDNNITINEIVWFSYYLNGSSLNCAIYARTVLPSPVILNPGDTKTFTYTIDLKSFVDNAYNT